MQGSFLKKRNRRRRHNPAERLSSSVNILGYADDHHRVSSELDLSNDHDTPTLPSGTRKRPRVEPTLQLEEPLSVNDEPSSRCDNDVDVPSSPKELEPRKSPLYSIEEDLPGNDTVDLGQTPEQRAETDYDACGLDALGPYDFNSGYFEFVNAPEDPDADGDDYDFDAENSPTAADGIDTTAITNEEEHRVEHQVTEGRQFSHAERKEDFSRSHRIVHTLKKKLRRATCLAIISLYGKARFTLDNYEHLVSLMSDYEKLPSASTMRQRVFPFLIGERFVKSTVVTCATKSGVSGSVKRSRTEGSGSTYVRTGKTDQAVLILPSSWAKIDIRCYHVLRELICLERCRCQMSMSVGDFRIQSTSHVIDRKKDSLKPFCLWISRDGLPFQAEVGTCISIHTFTDQEIPSSVTRRADVNFQQKKYRGEECTYFDAVIHSTYIVHHSSSHGSHLRHGLSKATPDADKQPFLDDCLLYLDSNCSVTTNYSDDNTNVCVQDPTLRPGDLITFLQKDNLMENGVLIVYVNRFWPSRLQDDRHTILFLFRNENGQVSSTSIPSFGVPSFVSAPDNLPSSQSNPCYTKGTLPNGGRYYVYSLLLYADDFTARSPLFPRGSVGGVYMSPAGLHIKSRRSQATIRTLSLTPPDVSTNVILDMMINDIVEGCLSGFECVDALGDKVRCFFDVIGFIADYPASTAAVDTKGHNAFAPCTHCTFHFSRSLLTSKYAYTTSILSSNSTYRRTDIRTWAVRSAGMDAHNLKTLGLTSGGCNSLLGLGTSPLLKLSHVYNQKLRSLEEKLNPNSYALDGYNINIIAPDHLIFGLMKGILLCSFKQLENEECRDRLQIFLKASLLDFGYQSQSRFFKDNKLVPGLTISMFYGIFTVLPSVLRSLKYLENLPTKELIVKIHSFMCLAFWWPTMQHDGHEACEFVHGIGKRDYHSALHTMASNFVKAVDRYARKYPDLGSQVDRPNTHRLIELTAHTIPKYGHILFVCELVFEAAHQPLKFF